MQFIFTITEVQREFLVKYPYAALDGELTILIKDQVFFKEEIALLALALCIAHWLEFLTKNQLPDFDYSSDEYEENSVLRLVRLDSHYFSIHSAWVDEYPDNVLGLGEITSCFRAFLQELDAAIQQRYGVAFAQIPLFSQ